MLIRLPPDVLRVAPGRAGWAPDGYVAYSKICTHAGCPVAIYRQQSYQLYCPCHQSVFDVLDAAQPVAGPATRALPQLALDVDAHGYLVARGDYDEPVGPDSWWRTI
jgi:ubiquinol-cytochrome c reductase iron-sulfur subunit